MLRPLALIAAFAATAIAAGCADLMQQTAISQIAPEWFEEKAGEVKGEGYPELADVPEVRPFSGTLKEWRSQAESLKTSADKLEANAASTEDRRTPEEIRATAAQWRALAEGSAAPSSGAEKPGR